MPQFTLTMSCPDRTGIVAAISNFIAERSGSIIEAAHFVDALSQRSFMRTTFMGDELPPLATLRREFEITADRYSMDWGLYDAERRCKVLVAVSKQGHCLNSLLHRWSNATLPIDIVGVLSNHETHRRLTEWYGLPFHHYPMEPGRKAEQEGRILALFESSGAELLVLARYMQILSDDMCRRLAGRCINIHHSFLPGFKGAKPYHQAYERGVKIIGATAHYATADLDEGPIIEQNVQRVDHSQQPDDLLEIGHDIEAIVLNNAVRWHAEHRIFITGNRTVVLRS
ncbi:MAG TPA: formyltetrahydrofolate deformylase [Steroidobacter sp.]|uniref:formyltetrahydrofolate deformylase n=1 Tax=Steroidobacter sp. TaxID=1978227 RepID=UPI002EDA8B0F